MNVVIVLSVIIVRKFGMIVGGGRCIIFFSSGVFVWCIEIVV